MKKKKMKYTELAPLFEMTPQGIRNWSLDNRPIIQLIEQYFTPEDVKEFLESGKVDRLEKLLKIEEIFEKSH